MTPPEVGCAFSQTRRLVLITGAAIGLVALWVCAAAAWLIVSIVKSRQ